jgi:threonyl-tRNA synthetase
MILIASKMTALEFLKTYSANDFKKRDLVAVKDINGKQYDLFRALEEGEYYPILKHTDEGLDILRHDYAHVLAQAVKELYPTTQIAIGPTITNGFYYDIYYEAESFTPDHLDKITARMNEIIERNENISRDTWKKSEAIAEFKNMGEGFKAEIIDAIPNNEEISVYTQGDFVDVCRGPHMPSTGWLKGSAFKLTKIAGAYWRGDSSREQMQRIYGTAFWTESALKEHLKNLEEAEKRDHRVLGKTLDLFHMQEESPGCIFWHPKGWTIYQTVKNYIRKRILSEGYVEVNTPILVDQSLWVASGHMEKFKENMFLLDEHNLAMKPMNCPCHVQIFKCGSKSYRDLPYRMAEFGSCFRNESSGSMHGMMRVRAMVQDDAHIFCTEDQILSETIRFCELLKSVYKHFGFENISVQFSTRPIKRAGSDETWDKAESALEHSLKTMGFEYKINPADGAFYGPKLEFHLVDCIGRSWQCGTLQLDFVLPERLGASYIGADNEKHVPVMLHRAICGSLERFVGILIEHHAGSFPFWLASIQICVMNISQDTEKYAQEVCDKFIDAGFRVELDIRNEKINYKVREWSLQKIPYICVVGKSEEESASVSVRKFGSNESTNYSVSGFMDMCVDLE